MKLILHSFQQVLWQPSFPLVLGAGGIAIGIALSLTRVSRGWCVTIAVACCIWWIALFNEYPVRGFDYEIYSYNAELTLNGGKAFGREWTEADGEYGISTRHPRYIDYTGAQHGTYVVLKSLDFGEVHGRLKEFGFKFWLVLQLALVCAILLLRTAQGFDDVLRAKFLPMVILAWHPIFVLHWIFPQWRDKIVFLTWPLLVACLLEKKHLRFAATLVGAVIALNGSLVFLLPAFCIFLFRQKGKVAYIECIFMAIGFVALMIPFFPDSLAGWGNRVQRINSEQPFWFSIYRLLPHDWYSPSNNRLAALAIASLATLAYMVRRLTIVDILLVSVGIVVILQPFIGVERILPLVMLIAVLTPGMTRLDWLLFVLSTSILFSVSLGYGSLDSQPLHLVLFHMPLF